MKKGIIALMIALFATVSLSAQTIQSNQRINQGVRSGELTKKETVRLKKQQHTLKVTKRRAAADGVITKKEKVKIAKKTNRLDKNIYRQKHDGQEQRRK